MTERVFRWRCTSCGDRGDFRYYSDDFALAVLAAMRKGHVKRKPGCSSGELKEET